jgi:hypothetical protein
MDEQRSQLKRAQAQQQFCHALLEVAQKAADRIMELEWELEKAKRVSALPLVSDCIKCGVALPSGYAYCDACKGALAAICRRFPYLGINLLDKDFRLNLAAIIQQERE